VALREPAQVNAHLWSGPQTAGAAPNQATPGGPPLASGQAATRRFGEHLHVAVVTVKLEGGPAPLTPGTLYAYNLAFSGTFGSADLKSEGLLRNETAGSRLAGVSADAPLHLALGYLENRLPTFVAPPATIDRLRLAHASCRKSNGPGYDALAWLDDHLEDNFTQRDERTQQLYLTGDQIYADDLGACLLPMLNALGHDMLGGDENLPVKNSTFPGTLANFPPLRRERLTREVAGFTSTAADNHLLTFGEYAAMYLAAWSPRVWRALPAADSLFTDKHSLPAALRDVLTDWEGCFGDSAKWKAARQKNVEDEQQLVELYRAGVPKVARALANVATYMIMDDHEVTDDWNLNTRWRNRVFTQPLGKTIVRNALMAYGVCQGWGNDPTAFESGQNKDFLDETVKVMAGTGPFPTASTDKLDELLGLTDAGGDKQVTWHYQVFTPCHVTAVMDSRTRRTFRGQGYRPPNLLGDTLNDQIPGGPLTDGRELLVVVSPAPVLGPNLIDRIGQPAAQIYFDLKTSVYEKLADKPHDPCKKGDPVAGAEEYDAEGWAGNEEAQEALLARLATHTRAVILSGDVHYGVSLTLDYWHKDVNQKSRIVQLTSSPSRNNFKQAVEAVVRSNALLQRYAQGLPAERLAWKDEAPISVPAGARLGPGRRARMKRKPALLPSRGWPPGTTLPNDKPPDWRWRLTLVRDGRPNAALPAPLQQPFLAQELLPADPLPAYRALAARHAQAAMTHFDHLRTLVFACNIGLIQFFNVGNTLTCRHTLLSKDAPESTTSAPNTVHEIALAPTNEAPPQLEVRNA